MCGILGGNKSNWNYQAAVESICHRGPNAQKVLKVKDFHLGFARLSIIFWQMPANLRPSVR